MKQKLTCIGGELALVIDQAHLHSLRIDQETSLDVSVVEGALMIRPIPRSDSDDLLEIADEIMDLHDETFRKLAL